MADLEELYINNTDFKEYVDKYCRQKQITKDEALQHRLVLEYAIYTTGKEYKA